MYISILSYYLTDDSFLNIILYNYPWIIIAQMVMHSAHEAKVTWFKFQQAKILNLLCYVPFYVQH